MNVGFYYHLEVVVEPDGSVRVPAHLGLLIEELAKRAGTITFYCHGGSTAGNEDYSLREPLVLPVDLGPRQSFPSRTLRPGRSLTNFRPHEQGIDVMLIQGPTPLLPAMARRTGKIASVLLIWGDYGAWQPRKEFPWWRNVLIWMWVKFYGVQQRLTARGRLAIVQNPLLGETVRGAKQIEIVTTSSVVGAALPPDVGPRPFDAGRGTSSPVRLLYTGRIVREKGLFEAVDAVAILKDQQLFATLDLAGWEDPRDPTIDTLLSHAKQAGVEDRVRYIGYIPAGADLLDVYDGADVFVIPTYWDSVPRSMQEAMAVGLPVVAANVGGIAHYLAEEQTAMLVPSRDPAAVAEAVRRLIADDTLRTKVAENGKAWARTLTLEASCDQILGHVRRWMETPKS